MASKYLVLATDLFEDDLDVAVRYYLESAGKRSAASFLDAYEHARQLLGAFPGHGSNVEGFPYRWKAIKSFIAIYSQDDATSVVMLRRLFYMSSNWRAKLLAGTAEGE